MKWFKWIFCLFFLVGGLAVGRWFLGPRLVEAEVRQLCERKDEEGALKALMRLAETDRTKAFDLLLTLETDGSHAVLRRLTAEVPEGGSDLMAAYLRHPEHHHVGVAGETAFLLCARADPARAWGAMTTHAVKFMPAFLPAMARGLTQRDPLEAMASAAKIQSPYYRERFVHDVLEEWSGQDDAGLLSWLSKQPDARVLARRVNWFRLRITDARGLADIAAMLPEDCARENLGNFPQSERETGEGAWISHTDWLLALPPGETRTRLCIVAAVGLAYRNPEAGLKLLPEVLDAKVRALMTSAVAGYRAAAAPDAGLAFASTLSDAEEHRNARNSVFLTWAENEPAGAAQHALKSGDPDAKIMLSTAGCAWARTDPEGASRFALEHDQQNATQDHGSLAMLPMAIKTWVGMEPVEAERWVRALPEGVQKDRALGAVASALVLRTPDEALRRAQDIKDAQARTRALRECLMAWSYRDPQKPAQWLEAAALDAETKRSLAAFFQPMTQGQPTKSSVTNLSDGVFVFY